MAKKERLDVLLTEKGYFESREKARKNILAGQVFVDGIRVDKVGTKIYIDSDILVKKSSQEFVSRGGLKLSAAFSAFNLDFTNKVVLDIGASTGGFTDCALKNKAQKVYAVDVGYGQLAWDLRNDSRVVTLERTNARYLSKEIISSSVDIATIDVSFISLELILPVVKKLGVKEIVALIKPQFEVGKDRVGKKGVIRDLSLHEEVINKIIIYNAEELKYRVAGLTYSPVKGPKGNMEFLIYLVNDETDELSQSDYRDKLKVLTSKIVKEAHIALQ